MTGGMGDHVRLIRNQSEGPKHFRGVQALRGIAAVIVVIHHATLLWADAVHITRQPSIYVWWEGAAGVDLFFVISGFVMTVTAARHSVEVSPALLFLQRRFVRIFPVYWLATVLFALYFWAVSIWPALNFAATPAPVLTLKWLIGSWFLLPMHAEAIVGVAWTLYFECFFYLLFSASLSLGCDPVKFLLPVLTVLASASLFDHPHSPLMNVLINPLLMEFAAGVAIGAMVLHGVRIGPRLGMLVGAAGALALFGRIHVDLPALHALSWGVPATLIVGGVVLSEQGTGSLWPKWLLQIGDASYSLYLIHLLVIRLVVTGLVASHLIEAHRVNRAGEWLTVGVCCLASVVASIGFWRFAERPLMTHSQQWIRKYV
jgi:exopolysaccharide production protein ExoZ